MKPYKVAAALRQIAGIEHLKDYATPFEITGNNETLAESLLRLSGEIELMQEPASPGWGTVLVNERQPHVILAWGNSTITIHHDDDERVFNRAARLTPLQGRLMVERLRHIAAEIENLYTNPELVLPEYR